MINKGNRREGKPILIRDNKANELERIPLDVKVFNEGWIQKLIHNNPDILPISEIDTGFTPAISIGREFATAVGFIDNLFISPEGYLTIAETKLWRNPQARREVVGQIIDYAKELNKWTYDDLNKRVIKFNQGNNNNSDGLWLTVRKKVELDDDDEKIFVDSISKNLNRGRFLLLIIGDGIQESVEDMVEFLSQTPQLHFTLALVELQVFKLNQQDNSLIVIPQIVTRTKEIIRAIVKNESNYPVIIDIPEEPLQGEGTFFELLIQNTNKETAEFARQIIKDCADLGLLKVWNQASITLRLPDPQGSDIRIAILKIGKRGRVNLGFSKPQFENLGLSREISYSFAADTASLLSGIQQHPERKHLWDKDSTLNDLRNVYPQFMTRLKKYIDNINTESEKAIDNK